MSRKKDREEYRKKLLIDLFLQVEHVTIQEITDMFNAQSYVDIFTGNAITLSKNTVGTYLADKEFIVKYYSPETYDLIVERKKQQKKEGNLAGGLSTREKYHPNHDDQVGLIVDILTKHPDSTYAEVAEYLEAQKNIEISSSTISRSINSETANKYITEKDKDELINKRKREYERKVKLVMELFKEHPDATYTDIIQYLKELHNIELGKDKISRILKSKKVIKYVSLEEQEDFINKASIRKC